MQRLTWTVITASAILPFAGSLSAAADSGTLPQNQTAEQAAASRLSVVEEDVFTELDNSGDGTAYVIVILKPGAPPGAPSPQVRAAVAQTRQRVLAVLAPDEFEPVYEYMNFPAMTGRVNAVGLARLDGHPDVLAIGTDAMGRGQLDDSVPFINADDVHATGSTGEGVTVAVLDTGIDSDHLDLADNVAAGWHHFLNQGVNVGPGAEDDHGHGSHVSGIITSAGQQSSVGVAPDADILAIKVLDSNKSGWVSDWAAGVDYVVQHKNDYDHLCVINMSLGTELLYYECPCDDVNAWTQLLQNSLQAAKDAGIVTFAASGNDGSCDSMGSPACLSAATAVAAVYDQNLGREPDNGTYNCGCFDAATAGDKIVCFSNRSACNELAAPGRRINAPAMGGGTVEMSGTSMATPHVAGVAALMCGWAADNGVTLTPDHIVQTMKDTGVATNDPCGLYPPPIRVDAQAVFDEELADIFLGRYWISARHQLGSHQIHEFDGNGGYTNHAVLQVAAAQGSAWGYRDGASDESGHIYFGWENGVARHDADGANGAQIIFAAAPAAVGIWRALAYDPTGDGGNGSLWAANFGSSLIEVDLAGNLLTSFPCVGWSLYGLAWDPCDGNLWGHDTDGMIIRISTTTGLAAGIWPTAFVNMQAQGGLSGLHDGSGRLAAVSQGGVDELGWYDSQTGALDGGPWPLDPHTGSIGHLGVAVVAPSPPCPGDINGDGAVDVVDLLALLATWGNPGGPADVNGDGIVDVVDLLTLLAAWGPCP